MAVNKQGKVEAASVVADALRLTATSLVGAASRDDLDEVIYTTDMETGEVPSSDRFLQNMPTGRYTRTVEWIVTSERAAYIEAGGRPM